MSEFITSVRKKTGCSKCRWSKHGCNGPRCRRHSDEPDDPEQKMVENKTKKNPPSPTGTDFIDDEASESSSGGSSSEDSSSSDENEYDYNDGFLVPDNEESEETSSIDESIEFERKRTAKILDELSTCNKQKKTLLRKYTEMKKQAMKMKKKAKTWKERAVELLLKLSKYEEEGEDTPI